MSQTSSAMVLPVREQLPIVSRKEHKLTRQKSPLHYELRVSGIGRLNKESVNNFKKWRISELQKPVADFRYVAGRLVLAIYMIVSLLATWIMAKMSSNFGLSLVFVFIGVSFLTIIGLFIEEALPTKHIPHLAAMWMPIDYETWRSQHPIPDKVQEIASEIKTRLPNVRLHVEYLYEDPLLRVDHTKEDGVIEREYLACWDEDDMIA